MVAYVLRAPITHQMELCKQHNISVIWAIDQTMDSEPVNRRELRDIPNRRLLGWKMY
jgi:hypothetical protein